MAFTSVTIVAGGLTWLLCSTRCMQRSVNELSLEVEQHVTQCPECTYHNIELLAVLGGAEPPEEEDPVQIPIDNPPRQAEPASASERRMTHEEPQTTSLSQQCPCPKSRPGRIVNNSFFNFVRERRQMYCGRLQKELVRAAAVEWGQMTECQKNYYKKENVLQRNR